MQVNNNYQPSFRAGKIDKQGLNALSQRLKAGNFQKFVDKFVSKHEGSDYKIFLGRGIGIKNGLDAIIEYGKGHFRYMEEGLFSTIFCHPISFMKKINKQIAKDLKSIAEKGHIF